MSYSYQENETTEVGGTWKCSTTTLTETTTRQNGKTVVFGGPDNNVTLSYDAVNNVDFGVSYRVTAGSDGAQVRVNAVRVKVYYTTPLTAPDTTARQLPGLAGVAMVSNIIVAGGTGGYVIRSSDGGSSWTEISVPFTSDVLSVSYLDDTFIITGKNGLYAESDDLGLTWTVIGIGTTESIYNSVYIPFIGYVVCGSNNATTHSADGLTWRDISSQVTDQ